MRNILLIGSVFISQTISVTAMESCCDNKGLESTAIRYARCINNSEEINPLTIINDLQFLSPAAMKSTLFAQYTQNNSFDVVATHAITVTQKQAVKLFTEGFEHIKSNDLLKAQFCMLLDKIIIHLKPSIQINTLLTNPMLKSLMETSSLKFDKMLVPSLAYNDGSQ